jgi:hypothetical protein
MTRMHAWRAAQVYDGTGFLGPATVMLDSEAILGVEPGHPDLPDGTEVATYDGTLLPASSTATCTSWPRRPSAASSGPVSSPTSSSTTGSATAWPPRRPVG